MQIHRFQVDGRPIRTRFKEYAALKVSGFLWTGPLLWFHESTITDTGIVIRYSDWSEWLLTSERRAPCHCLVSVRPYTCTTIPWLLTQQMPLDSQENTRKLVITSGISDGPSTQQLGKTYHQSNVGRGYVRVWIWVRVGLRVRLRVTKFELKFELLVNFISFYIV